ncbi:hypothetical protein HK099_000105, partial [Clydaea vesicula]
MVLTEANLNKVNKVLNSEKDHALDNVHEEDYFSDLPSKVDLKKVIPEGLFSKSLTKSTLYWLRDLLAISATVYFYFKYQPAGWIYVLWANVLGLLMWCTFMIGHDAGHGSFSDYQRLNFYVGLLSHGPLLVPFRQWKKSHQLHHLGHNSMSKDKSHSHYTFEGEGAYFLTRATPVFIPLGFGLFYLALGLNDGSHFSVNYYAKNRADKIDNFLSILSCSIFLTLYYILLQQEFFFCFGLPWLIYNGWVYSVTFLQHHHDNMTVYNDNDWDFMKGAVETIDRNFGFGLDDLTHNITNGHLVHHIFFTQIPHYNLMEATKYVRPVLGKYYKLENKFWLRELIEDHFFFTRRSVFERKDGNWTYKKMFPDGKLSDIL